MPTDGGPKQDVTLEYLANEYNIRLLEWYAKEYTYAAELMDHLLSKDTKIITKEDCKLLTALYYCSNKAPSGKLKKVADRLSRACDDISSCNVRNRFRDDVVQPMVDYVSRKEMLDAVFDVKYRLQGVGVYVEKTCNPDIFKPGEILTPSLQQIADMYMLCYHAYRVMVHFSAAHWQLFWALVAYDRDGTRFNLLECFRLFSEEGNLYTARKQSKPCDTPER